MVPFVYNLNILCTASSSCSICAALPCSLKSPMVYEETVELFPNLLSRKMVASAYVEHAGIFRSDNNVNESAYF